MSAIPSDDRLSLWQRRGLIALLVAVFAFGIVVEIRSAFLERRMGDLDVYLRTAWAVRVGWDIYQIPDHNGWHYHYPPLFAILLTPLADPPPFADKAGYLPYPMTVAIWYALSIAFLANAVHMLAAALEETALPAVHGAVANRSRRWWALRVLPVVACLPPIGHTLMRGQVSLLLLFLLCGMAAATLRGRRWQAGFWLAGAICLKVIPAFLLLFPAWRRDWRGLAGCAIGLFIGLALIPAAVFGPLRAFHYYQEWTEVLFMPAVADGADQSRAKELLETTATHSQSFVAVLHNTLHPDPSSRPPQAAPAVRLAHWLIGGLLVLITLWAAGWRRQRSGTDELLFLSSLVVLMLLLSPVCHMHYFCVLVPMLIGLMIPGWQGANSSHIGAGVKVLLGVVLGACALPLIPGLEFVRDLGLSLYGALLLWAVAVWRLFRTTKSSGLEVRQEHGPAKAAA